ncbi:MAG: family 78 glycoside hydrolase catalytic domain, partial [bacterium]|nr:family 78 glycoside hydrolase catalytic domain [bacterium]
AGKEWEPRFTYHGFQYIQVTGLSDRSGIEDLRGQVVHTAVCPVGSFTCSSEQLNKTWANTCRSHLSNLHGYPTDCPHREKNGWTGDAHLAAEEGIYNFDMATTYAKWMEDFQDEQQPGGELPGIVPTGGWGYEWGNGPAWDSAYIQIPWYLYLYYGDTRVLERHYPNMRRYVDYLTGKARDGIVDIGLGDWCPAATETPIEVTSTGYYYSDTNIVARTAALLGKMEDAEKYAALAAEIRRAFNREFFDKATGLYANGSQTAQSCALYHHLTETEHCDIVLQRLIEDIEKKDWHLDTGILGAKYVMNVLTDYDRADIAYRIATQKTYPGLGYWIEQGATTLWERWDGEYSRNHIMFGDIAAWMYKTLAGINPDPDKPGFENIVVKPHPVDDLTFAEATYDSIRGRIRSRWERTGDGLELQLTIPVNATATVHLPFPDACGIKVRVGNTGTPVPAGQAEGMEYLGRRQGRIIYSISSGNYLFVEY